MIEKLKKQNTWGECLEKLNEIIDAVNVLQAQVAILEEHAHPTAKTPVDPYEEQRKWIGKLCWFWSGNFKQCGILTAIFDNNKYGENDPTEEYPFQRDSIGCWQHCEPVKPDDDIIYKGE